MKRKFFVDFDDTIVNSTKAICDIYNITMRANADWTKVNQWDFADECPLYGSMVASHFESKWFFDMVEIMPHAYEVLELLNEKYELVICSIGTYKNIMYKSQWIGKYLPFIQQSAFIVREDGKTNKSLINMQGGILLDDHIDNLLTSNAYYKYCFGKTKSWNTEWDRDRLVDWQEVEYHFI